MTSGVKGARIARLLALTLLCTTTACSSGADTAKRESHDGNSVSASPMANATHNMAHNLAHDVAQTATDTVLTEVADADIFPQAPASHSSAKPSPGQRPRAAADTSPLPDLPESNVAGDPTPFPTEVTTFMVDRDGCDHFRGEEPYDAERRAYLEKSIRDLCTGTDAKLADLRQRYARNQDVMAALAGYEGRIEVDPDE